MPATNTAAGSSNRTAMPASLQKFSPWRTKPNTRAWNGTIHANPAITQAKSCCRIKLHCWVCAGFVTISCIERALPRDRTAFESRRAHCYKTGTENVNKIGGRRAQQQVGFDQK